MSLLLDALKKAGRNGQDAAHDGASPAHTTELTLESPSALPRQKAAQQIEDNLARITGQNLFAAKSSPAHSRPKLGIVPIALISGLLFAAGGAYYIWHETSYTPPPKGATAALSQPVSVPAQKAVPEAPTNTGMAHPQAPLANVAVAKQPPVPPRRTASKPAPAVVVEHNQTGDRVDPSLTTAYQAYRNGDFAGAWQHYRTVLQRDAKNRDALLGMAAVAQRQGQYDMAAEYYGRLLTLDPRDPAAHAGLSSLSTGDAAVTESRLKLLLTHRPDEAALHFALGNLYVRQSRWGDAQQAYFNAYNREPDNAQFAYNLAVSLDHLSQGKLAAQHYQRALKLDSTGSAGFDRTQTQQRVQELTAP